ncbi:MAG: hypothetical protein ACOVNU_14445 [Candidatus Kapaibacteriota bacterium]|jgi:hypothetical protein
MTKLKSLLLLGLYLVVSVFGSFDLQALPLKEYYDKVTKEREDELQRLSTGYFDNQKNTVSNVEFFTSNYGIFGFDIARGIGSGYWPRGSRNQYIFGGGMWFGSKKRSINTEGQELSRTYVNVSYDPSLAASWMTPGRIEEGVPNKQDLSKYRVYFSTDFNSKTGAPFNKADGPNWPIWDTGLEPFNPNYDASKDSIKFSRYFGKYVNDVGNRNTNKWPKGPAMISGEDIFSTFNDADLTRYQGGPNLRRSQGYPLNIQTEQMIYSWGFGDYKDFLFVKFDIINMSQDTLWDCWMAPIMDVDLARAPQLAIGAQNDRVKYYDKEDTLNMACQWTDGQFGEGGFGFGYLGFDWLESPATIKHFGNVMVYDTVEVNGNIQIDSTVQYREVKKIDSDFVRKDSAFYSNSSQLGLRTFRNWSSADDIREDFARYQFISQGGNQLGISEPGDKRFMMSTGPFHIRPRDTSRVVVGIILANGAKGGDADGSDEDMANLVRLDKFAQSVYDNNFQAPIPPDPVVITQKRGYNNSVVLEWDTNSENSVDALEDGLDFMGYRIYRARRLDQDTISESSGNRAGPLGWKQIAQYQIPTPFEKSVRKIKTSGGEIVLDSIRIVGNYIDPVKNTVDTMSISVMRVGQGIFTIPDNLVAANYPNQPFVPFIAQVDSSRKPWGEYFRQFAPNNRSQYPYRPDVSKDDKLFKEMLVGKVVLNRSLVPYNPMFFRPITQTITDAQFAALPDNGVIYQKINAVTVIKVDSLDAEGKPVLDAGGKVIRRDSLDANGNKVTQVQLVESSIADTVFKKNTYRKVALPDGNVYGVIDVLLPRPISAQMRDTTHIKMVLDSLYSFIQQGVATLVFPQFEQSLEVRNNVIMPYMSELTNGRKFVDIGDDNRDGVIDFNADITKTEKLINNVDYYYKILSYDEGDVNKRTEPKLNNAQIGNPNFADLIPKAAPAGNEVRIELIEADVAKLGGIHNIQINPLNNDRVLQNFQGDTLELEFQPQWTSVGVEDDSTRLVTQVGTYARQVTLKNITKNTTLYDGFQFLERDLCRQSTRNLLTENTFSLTNLAEMIVDTLTGESSDLGMPNSLQKVPVFGTFTTGDFKDRKYCYASGMEDPAYGTMELKFDYGFEHFGGIYRPLEDLTIPEGVDVNVKAITTSIAPPANPFSDATNDFGTARASIYVTGIYPNGLLQNSSFDFTSFNNGPGEYEIEFLPGGMEKVTLSSSKGAITNTFDIPYLNIKVTNKLKYSFEDINGQTREVSNGNEMPHYEFPILRDRPFVNNQTGAQTPLIGRAYPDPRNIPSSGGDANEFLGKFNISSYGWFDGRKRITAFNVPNMVVRSTSDDYVAKADFSYTGLQGRYYLSTKTADGVPLDFTHLVNLGGTQFALDFANKGRTNSQTVLWPLRKTADGSADLIVDDNTKDFKAGDKITLKTYGGVAGLPLPGAKAKFVVKGGEPTDGNYTSDMLNGVTVVPNPYYISHEGQRSPYEAKLYLTRLPRECTIEIYTVAGDLIQTLNHNSNDTGLNDKIGFDVWDLLTKNGLRVQSQTLLAVIRTPNGEESVRPFSVVVGPFRIID